MLDRAVNAIRNGAKPDLDAALHQGIEVNMHLPALIPDDYLPDVNMRLTLYKRLSNCETKEHLHELQVEIIDRFGLLPDPVKVLFQLAELRQLGEKLGLKKIEAGPNGGRLQFTANTLVEPMAIVTMVQSQPSIFRLQNNDQLSFTMAMDSPAARFEQVNDILQQLLSAA
jgi:transcription-repair coupling factor (superfamily II helicase)